MGLSKSPIRKSVACRKNIWQANSHGRVFEDRLALVIVLVPTAKRADRHVVIPRKEVIQPHLPIRLPCYDLVPLTSLTFGTSLLTVGTMTSGATNSGGLTGGVYKAQEQIHRGVADPRLLAIPASSRRIAACYPNWGRLSGIGSVSRLGNPLYRPL